MRSTASASLPSSITWRSSEAAVAVAGGELCRAAGRGVDVRSFGLSRRVPACVDFGTSATFRHHALAISVGLPQKSRRHYKRGMRACRFWWSGQGWSGLAIARKAALDGHDVIVAEAANADRHRRVVAQQRGHPRRPLLHDRLEARLSLPARAAHALRVLRLARRAAQEMRQAGRRDQRAGDREARRHPQAVADQRRRGRRDDRRLRRRAAWSRSLSCVAALHSPETGVVDSHRYMQRAAGRPRRPRRHDRVQHQDRPHHAGAGRLAAAGGRRHHHGRCRGQRGGPRRAEARRAQPRAIRRSACRGCFSARAATSVTRAGRCSRG